MFRWLGRAFLFIITCTSVLAVLLIFYFVIRRAVPFLKSYSLVTFLTDSGWYPTAEQPVFGALALIAGSIYVTFGALIFAVPLGLLAAVFLSDIVSFKIRNIVKPVIEILAAIPSVAYGFFAVLILAPWMQNKFGFTTGTNALNASIILSVMALPTIISVSEDSLSAVGRELREASYGLGATRMETIFKVIIPAAHSGIIAAVVLGMMRAIGETMVVWMASGNASQIPHPWWDITQSIRTMTATIAGDMGEAPEGSMHRSSLFAIGVLLLILTFGLNLVSEYFLSSAKKSLGKTK
jgi:phosphate transport system permease protein